MSIVSKLKELKLQRQIAYLEERFINIKQPESIAKKFSELIGMESEKTELRDAVRYLNELAIHIADPIHAPNSRFILGGAPGSGKTKLVASIAKEVNVPLIRVDMTSFVSFPDDAIKILDTLFDVIESLTDGCVVHVQNFSAITSLPQETIMLFHNNMVRGIAECKNAVVILSSIENQIGLPIMYFSPNVFSNNKVVRIQPPTPSARAALFQEYIEKYGLTLASDLTVERLASNTFGMLPKDIEYIVKETKLRAESNGIRILSLKEFNDVMLDMVDTKTHLTMNEKERTSTAYHEAGHVVAAYYNPDHNYTLGRVEITPRSASLGLTQEESTEEKHTMFKSDFRNNIIYTFGGMVAERIIYGENTSGVSGDLAYNTLIALSMIAEWGMENDIGPIVSEDEYGFISVDITNKIEEKAQAYLKDLYQKTYEIVESHREQLEALTQALVKYEVLMGEEIKKIFDEIDNK